MDRLACAEAWLAEVVALMVLKSQVERNNKQLTRIKTILSTNHSSNCNSIARQCLSKLQLEAELGIKVSHAVNEWHSFLINT